MLVVPGAETALLRIQTQFDLPAFQYRAELVAKHRQQYLAFEVAAAGMPVDIEESGVRRVLTPLEHVHPPGVVGADAHVVRHDVDDQAQVARLQGLVQRLETLLAAEFGIDPGVVDDVVTVRGAGARGHDR